MAVKHSSHYVPHKRRSAKLLVILLFSGHFDHGLRRTVEEDEFLKQRLLKLHLSCLSDHENVRAKLQHPVDARQLLEHDGPGDPVEEFSDEFPNNQHHRHVQAHDTEEERPKLL